MMHPSSGPRMWPGALSVAVLAAGMLGGCAGDAADPTNITGPPASSSSASPTSPATSASPSPTSMYVPVKPRFPAAAKKRNGEGAVAFVEYYWAALNYAWTKPDKEILVGLSAKSCSVCDFFETTAADLVRDGKRLDKDPIRVDAARLVYVAGDEGQVFTEVSRTDASILDRNGKILATNTPTQGARGFLLRWTGKWSIIKLGDAL